MTVPSAAPYVLFEPPFEGGLGRVYKAIDPRAPGKFFALKFAKDPSNSVHVKRLEKEAKLLGAIQHPNVMKLVAAHMDRSPPFLVFEYLSGGSLHDRIGPQGLPFHVAALVLCQIAGALGAFHALDGFHRDVKPGNILVTGDGSFVLADANLAALPSGAGTFTQTVFGTPGYIDPWAVNKSFDWRADVWSLGVTFAQALTGKTPNEVVVNGEFGLAPDKIKAPTDGHRKAVIRLLVAMLRKERDLRPTATLIQQYAQILMVGGTLPLLPGDVPPVPKKPPVAKEPTKPVKPTPPPPPVVPAEAGVMAAMGAIALVGLIVVGIAAILGDNGGE